ncbi:hypothetical protein [Streptomyces odonnellii]|uniref:hypothetical protein n=1 Tax=Streptomyces odonnellii TaxID=1417980 RepID=UPI000626D271|nr:hypothetical protein [Streptomyces odonnellii]
MRTRTTTAAVAALLLATLTACGTEPEPSAKAAASAPATLSAEDKAAAREAAGLPPEPNATTRAAFLDALTAIDPRIIKPGKDDQAVSRGLNQCSSIKSSPDDREKLSQQALDRFTVNTRLPDIATPETGGKIVDVVRKHLCPDF